MAITDLPSYLRRNARNLGASASVIGVCAPNEYVFLLRATMPTAIAPRKLIPPAANAC